MVIPSQDKKMQTGMKNETALKFPNSSIGSGLRNKRGKAVTKENAKAIMKPSRVPHFF